MSESTKPMRELAESLRQAIMAEANRRTATGGCPTLETVKAIDMCEQFCRELVDFVLRAHGLKDAGA